MMPDAKIGCLLEVFINKMKTHFVIYLNDKDRTPAIHKARSQDISPFETVLPGAIQNHGQRTGAPILVRWEAGGQT